MAKVLVIDDSNLTRTVARIALRREGHEVIEAETPDTGLDFARKHQPTVIVTGLPMSLLVGQTLLRRLQETTHAPIIVIARDVSESTRAQCAACGVTMFLPPPIHGQDVANAVGLALGHNTRARAA